MAWTNNYNKLSNSPWLSCCLVISDSPWELCIHYIICIKSCCSKIKLPVLICTTSFLSCYRWWVNFVQRSSSDAAITKSNCVLGGSCPLPLWITSTSVTFYINRNDSYIPFELIVKYRNTCWSCRNSYRTIWSRRHIVASSTVLSSWRTSNGQASSKICRFIKVGPIWSIPRNTGISIYFPHSIWPAPTFAVRRAFSIAPWSTNWRTKWCIFAQP